MKIELRNFIIQAFIAAVLILFITVLLKMFHIIEHSIAPIYYLVPFIMLVTIAFHAFLMYSATKGDRMFISKYIASSGLKLMIYLVAILILIFSKAANIKFVMVMILISYLIFSVLEVYAILKYMKK